MRARSWISILKIATIMSLDSRVSARDFSEELISRLGLLELPWDWKSTCVHLLFYLPTWAYQPRGPASRDTLCYFDNIEISGFSFWCQVTFGIDILLLIINRYWFCKKHQINCISPLAVLNYFEIFLYFYIQWGIITSFSLNMSHFYIIFLVGK